MTPSFQLQRFCFCTGHSLFRVIMVGVSRLSFQVRKRGCEGLKELIRNRGIGFASVKKSEEKVVTCSSVCSKRSTIEIETKLINRLSGFWSKLEFILEVCWGGGRGHRCVRLQSIKEFVRSWLTWSWTNRLKVTSASKTRLDLNYGIFLCRV